MRKVMHQLRQYKKDTFLCIGLTALEVVMEILLPFITAKIIDQGLQQSNMPAVCRFGALMVIMAFFSLFSARQPVNSPPARLPACRPICARRFTPISRPFRFPTSTNSACRALSPA